MAHFRSLRSPFAVCAAVAEFDEVKYVVYINGLESVTVLLSFKRCDIFEAGKLACHAVVEYRKRSCSKRFCHKEILIESDML